MCVDLHVCVYMQVYTHVSMSLCLPQRAHASFSLCRVYIVCARPHSFSAISSSLRAPCTGAGGVGAHARTIRFHPRGQGRWCETRNGKRCERHLYTRADVRAGWMSKARHGWRVSGVDAVHQATHRLFRLASLVIVVVLLSATDDERHCRVFVRVVWALEL